MYKKYGFFKETQYTITLKGIDGNRQIAAIMDKLRNDAPKEFGNKKVLAVRDYQTGKVLEVESGKESEAELPISNVLYFELPDDCWCCARPSGTEPKIKFYMGVKGMSLEDATIQLKILEESMKALVTNMNN